MRLLFLLAAGLVIAAPASAQIVQCEGSADGKAGEVLAAYDLGKDGQVQKLTMSFLPERVEDVGVESDYFARPRILLDYRLNEAGELAGPTAANVMITRFSNPGAGKPPPMSTVDVKATAAPTEPLSWNAADPTAGERRLASMLRDQKPAKLKIDVVNKAGKVLASADFDLSKTEQVQKLVTQAKADGDKRVAAFQKALGEGKAPTRCP
jgi:hypothetical protein